MEYPAVTRGQMREMDRIAIEEFGVPGVVLMENAGRAVAEETVRLRGEAPGPVCIVAGRGNNGGDAFVAARHLANRGVPLDLFFTGDLDAADPGTDAGINLFVLLKMGLLVRELGRVEAARTLEQKLGDASVVVDALLGTGTRGEVAEPLRSLIDAINRSPGRVVAVDLPSGLDADTGEILGISVRADVTVTFGLPKTGFARGAGLGQCGKIVVADIGLPQQVVERVLGGEGA
jgi:NAD(P)H-hydrate epimerase